MNRIKILVTGIVLLSVSGLTAQEGVVALSLKECVEMAVENNINNEMINKKLYK